jgi:hypothetical protein
VVVEVVVEEVVLFRATVKVKATMIKILELHQVSEEHLELVMAEEGDLPKIRVNPTAVI